MNDLGLTVHLGSKQTGSCDKLWEGLQKDRCLLFDGWIVLCVGIDASMRDACQIAKTMAEQLRNQDFEFAISGCVWE